MLMDVAKSKSPQKAAARLPSTGGKFRVTGLSFFAYGRLFKAGDELIYDGVPGAALIPLDDKAHEMVAAKNVKVEAKPKQASKK